MIFKFAVIKTSSSQTIFVFELIDSDMFSAFKQAHNKCVIELGKTYDKEYDLFIKIKG